jgi:D-proline reductase (dithiol) PrdB
LDHQTVGLVARVIEEAGIPTVYVGTARDLTEQVLPPRSVFVNYPMGNPFGRPHEVAHQRQILMDTLNHALNAAEPGEMVDLPYDWGERILTIMELETGWSARPPDPVTGKQPT